jgi:hypothetical protein
VLRALDATRRLIKRLEDQEALLVFSAEQCQQSAIAMQALYRVYSRAVTDSSTPLGLSLGAGRSAEEMLSCGPNMAPVNVFVGLEGEGLCLYRTEKHFKMGAEPFAKLFPLDHRARARPPPEGCDLHVDLTSGGKKEMSGCAGAPFITVATAEGDLTYSNPRRLFTTSRRTQRLMAEADARDGAQSWSEEEDGALFVAVARLGMSKWTAVAEALAAEMGEIEQGTSTAQSEASAATESRVSQSQAEAARGPRKGSECQQRWAALLEEQLDEARTRQNSAHRAGLQAERELSQIMSEIMSVKRLMASVSRLMPKTARSAAALQEDAAKEVRSLVAINLSKAERTGKHAMGSIKPVDVRVGAQLLAVCDAEEEMLKRENESILTEFPHLQQLKPQWMVDAKLPPRATHYKLERLAGFRPRQVAAACQANEPPKPTPIDPSVVFAPPSDDEGEGEGEGEGEDEDEDEVVESDEASEEEGEEDEEEKAEGCDGALQSPIARKSQTYAPLRAADAAVRGVIGDRGQPISASIDLLLAANSKTEAGFEAGTGWMRVPSAFAGPSRWGGLLVLLVTSGTLRFRIAGYSTVTLHAGGVAVLSAALWVRALTHEGHVLALTYSGVEPVRLGPSTKHIPAPGYTKTYLEREEAKREAQKEKQMSALGPLMPKQPVPWAAAPPPLSRADLGLQMARESAKSEKALLEKLAATRVAPARKPSLPGTPRK